MHHSFAVVNNHKRSPCDLSPRDVNKVFKAGRISSHFIAFHRNLRSSNCMKVENRNSSEFLLFHLRKQSFLIRWDQLRRITMNYDELGLLLLLTIYFTLARKTIYIYT